MAEHEDTEEACRNYRPMLDNGKLADITLDEMLENIGMVYYILRIDARDYCVSREYAIRLHASEKFREVYNHSKVEVRPLVHALIDSTFKIGDKLEPYLRGQIPRSQLPLEDTPGNDLMLGLLIKLNRITHVQDQYRSSDY